MFFDRTLMKLAIIVAHADDAELMCGAWFRDVVERGQYQEINVITFSDHRGVPENYSPLVREEFRRSMSILGASRAYLGELQACTGEFQRRRGDILKEIECCRDHVSDPNVVITHSPYDTNQDHRTVYEEVVRAFKKKTTILSGVFPTNEVIAPAPNVFFPVTSRGVATKVTALRCYKSQLSQTTHSYMQTANIWAQAKYWGSLIDQPYAEAFHMIRMIG